MIKSWPKLLLSILLSQSAGFIGTFFTVSAIPTWYALLNKPSFSPPNWLFGPVWTILYTLIGISMYLIWTSKKSSLKLFFFHLFLNAIWSPIFFGLKNLGVAFLVILLMDVSLIIMIKKFYKINKIASFVLIPYLLWITFASFLNFSIWRLNPQNTVKNIFAQDFTFKKSHDDYVFTQDTYNRDLFDYNLKKAAYQQNQTLSLKEELRLSLYKFIGARNELIKNYLTMIRMKTLELSGLNNSQKTLIYSKIDPEVAWYDSRKNSYSPNDRLEDLINKSKDEDLKYTNNTLSIIDLSLTYISLGEVKGSQQSHVVLYEKLKDESANLIKLGRADASLFDRWFTDINGEIDILSKIEDSTELKIQKIFGADDYERSSAYKNALNEIVPAKQELLKLNGFISELENILTSKR